MMEQARSLLRDRVLPHLGIDDASFRKKAAYVCSMVRRLISAYVGLAEEDDRDHLGRKRVDSAGELMLSLFTYEFKNYIEGAKRLLARRLVRRGGGELGETQVIFDDRIITGSLRHAFSTGQWGRTRRGEVIRCGVAQVLKRDTTYFATLSHLRRIAHPVTPSSKSVKLRLLHNTQFGMVCPSETPEGAKIGVVKNLALLAKISINLTPGQTERLLESIRESGCLTIFDVNVSVAGSEGETRVVVDGNFIGSTAAPLKLAHYLRLLRRTAVLSDSLSISLDYANKEIRIFTDSGRLMRPLLVVEDDALKLTPRDL